MPASSFQTKYGYFQQPYSTQTVGSPHHETDLREAADLGGRNNRGETWCQRRAAQTVEESGRSLVVVLIATMAGPWHIL